MVRYAEGIIRAIQALCSGYHGNRRKMRNEKQKGVEERARGPAQLGGDFVPGDPRRTQVCGNVAKFGEQRQVVKGGEAKTQ